MPRSRPDKGKSRVPFDQLVARLAKMPVPAPRTPVTAKPKLAAARRIQAAYEGTPAFRLNEALCDPSCG